MRLRTLGLTAVLLVSTGCAAPGEGPRAPSRPVASTECRPSRDSGSAILQTCRIVSSGTNAVHEWSGIYYDHRTSTLWAAADDTRTEPDDPARFELFTLSAALVMEGRATQFLTRPRPPDGRTTASWQIEALAPVIVGDQPTGEFFVASERDTWSRVVGSQIYRCTRVGRCTIAVTLPQEFAATPGGARPTGVDDNQGFEGLTTSPDGTRVFAALERPLFQESAPSGERARVRLLAFDPAHPGTPRQYVYELDALPRGVVVPTGAPGVSEILARSNSEVMVLERSYSAGCGNTIRLYQVDVDNGQPLRPGQRTTDVRPLRKQLLIDFTDERSAFDDAKLSAALENFEGMTFGPDLPDATRTLLLVSDDNARPDQITALVSLRLSSLPTPSALRWRDGDAPVCPQSRG